MSTDAQTAKQFKVKFAALKRYVCPLLHKAHKCSLFNRIQKDLAYARKEIGQEEARLEKIMNAEEKDDYRIRQQVRRRESTHNTFTHHTTPSHHTEASAAGEQGHGARRHPQVQEGR